MKQKTVDPDTSIQQREDFYNDIAAGSLSLADAVKRMRHIVGMTQADYAKLIGIAPRVLMDIERGVANPRLSTLEKLAKPFGLNLGFIRTKR